MNSISNKININSETVSKTIDNFRKSKTNNNQISNDITVEEFTKEPLIKTNEDETNTELNGAPGSITNPYNINESSENPIQVDTNKGFDDDVLENDPKDLNGNKFKDTITLTSLRIIASLNILYPSFR